ncbi:MAG: pyridoxal 5'-phosphate synthase glutaminase subunit PdxT [Mycoplasmatales bacterium]
MLTIGILGLQGAIKEHQQVILRNGYTAQIVRTSADLNEIDAIILPGGESTVMRKLLEQNLDFKKKLQEFLITKPVYATCAGVILLSESYFNILNLQVIRNGFGSQIASESTNLRWNNVVQPVAFIRAPIIKVQNQEQYQTVVWHKAEVVGVETKNIMAMSFHPELTKADIFFNYFIQKIVKDKK